MDQSNQIRRNRLGIFSGALLLGLTLARFVETPVRPLSAPVLGSPLGINLSATTLMLLILAGLSVTAVEAFVRSHPIALAGELGRSTIYWILPALLVVGLSGWLAAAGNQGIWVAGFVLSALLVPVALAVEYAHVDPQERQRPLIHWSEIALIYLVTVTLYALIFDQRARTLLSGPAVIVVTTLLAARFLYFSVDKTGDAFLYGSTVGILLGLMTWVINYWPISTFQGSLTLFLLFYAVVGLIQQNLDGRFGRRTVMEYAVVAILGFLLLMTLF